PLRGSPGPRRLPADSARSGRGVTTSVDDGAMDQPAVSFGALLRRHRLLVGLSQEELAERAHLSLSAVGSLERGINREPYPKTVALLAAALALDSGQRSTLIAAARSSGEARPGRPAGRVGREPDRLPVAMVPTNLPAATTSFVGREREV